jgi:hypothetical protein
MFEVHSEPGYLNEIDRQRYSLWAAVFAGLLAALTAAILLCRTPQAATPELLLALLAGAYLTLAALSGITGSYVYWIRSRARLAPGFADLLQSTAAGWVWIPAIVLLSRQDSAWAPAVAAAGAAVLAVSLRRTGPAALDQSSAPVPVIDEPLQQELFAQSLRTARAEWYGPAIAVCIFGEALVLARGWLFPGCVFLASAAFAFSWARTPAAHPGSIRKITTAALRQAKSAVPALIITMLAMLIGMRHDIQQWGAGFDLAHRHHTADSKNLLKKQDIQPHAGAGGHVSVILLTAPLKQQLIAPRTKDPILHTARLTKPMVIQFDGEYWYFQPPYSDPGPGAFIARTSPLTANIHSVLSIPILMQAHQHLGTPLPIECCREVDVEVENREDRPGSIVMGVMLTDSASPGKPSLLLGERAISSNANSRNSTAAHETLRFSIPTQSGPVQRRIHQFDQIDFVIVPDSSRMQSGAKVAIRTLEFIP